MTLLSDPDFLSSFLKIDWLEAIRDFYRAEHLYIVPGVYREISRTGLVAKVDLMEWIQVRLLMITSQSSPSRTA